MKKFEPFETTADVGLSVYGEDLIELFENAALGMFSLMVESFTITKPVRKVIEVEGDRDEDIIVSLLSELIFLFETDGFILGNITGNMKTSKKFQFTLVGETYSKEKHILSTHIKAVTYHKLEIKRDNKIFIVDIVFDV
ncbi:archease [bacterium]|nr:archease [bacterium]